MDHGHLIDDISNVCCNRAFVLLHLLARIKSEIRIFTLTTLCLKKTGPLLHFQITPTILSQYQQILVQRIVN